MVDFAIGEVVKRTGLAASAIRYYESVGVVPKPNRKNGRRVYDENWMKRLGIVLLAQEVGFSIKEIRQLVHQFAMTKSPPSKRWQKVAKEKLDELAAQKQHIQQMQQLLEKLLLCSCPTIEDCGDIALKYIVNR